MCLVNMMSSMLFISGGFSGQLAVYGLPSGRLFKVIPVFSQDAEKSLGYNENQTHAQYLAWICALGTIYTTDISKPMVCWMGVGSSSMETIRLVLRKLI